MAVIRHHGFYGTAISAIRSADPENHNLEPNMDRMHRLRDIRL